MNRWRKYGGTLALIVAAGTSAAAAQVPQPGQGSSGPRRLEIPRGAYFDFHSNFWVNLHHFVYQQARLAELQSTAASPVPAAAKPVDTSALSDAERASWKDALTHYTNVMTRRDLLFNGDMVNIKNRLSEWEAEPDLQKSGLRAELIAALEGAAPVYRKHWWPAHDRANRAWIAAVEPMVQKLGRRLTTELSNVYQSPWPREPIRTDVSVYGGRVGAYTTLMPTHITISSAHENNQGRAAFEILFHEASHALTSEVAAAIARECRARNKPTPRDLWHAVLFYTTGEMVKRTLQAAAAAEKAADRPGEKKEGPYTPYAYQHRLYERGWQSYQRVLETHWQQYLDGKIEFDRAILRMVAAL